jgi:hypothetical protein
VPWETHHPKQKFANTGHCRKAALLKKHTVRVPISHSLYFFYPIFEDNFFVSKDCFWKILTLGVVTIQERFAIERGPL